jgi:TolB-like protein
MIFTTFSSPNAKDKISVIVLPFSVHSSENLEYVRQGVWDMLSNRLSSNDQIQVISKENILDLVKAYEGKEPGYKDLQDIGKKKNASYIVWGSITKIGKSISIDSKLLEVSSGNDTLSLSSQAQSLDDVIPKIGDFSKSLVTRIVGTPATETAITPPSPSSLEITTQSPKPPLVESPFVSKESQIVGSIKSNKKGTFTSIINPDIQNTSVPMDRKSFWMSQKFPYDLKGMDIGDVKGDGKNEIVLIDAHRVMIFQKTDTELKMIDSYEGKSYENFLAVDIADINHNGIPEIIVTSIGNKTLMSFILEYRDGKLTKIASDLRWFFRIIRSDSGEPMLIGQQLGVNNPFDTPIYKFIYEGGQYKTTEKLKIPEGLSVYGLAISNVSSDVGTKVIALNKLNHLCMFSQTDKPLIKLEVIGGSDDMKCTDDSFGGSNNTFERINTPREDDTQIYEYVKPRIIIHDTNSDKKKEIIVVKNISQTGDVFKKFKLYTSSEMFNLEWDGIGFSENWKTKKINGYVADYQIKDIDNDGQNEIVMALVLSVGMSVSDKSAIAIYKMAPPQAVQP